VISRRRFLFSTALAGAGLGAGTAAAFSIEEPGETLRSTYLAAKSCSRPDSEHAQLIAEVEALLEGRELPEEARREIMAATICPVCGCAIGG
jgi:hypothetical protein